MILLSNKLTVIVLFLILKANIISSVLWDSLRCSSDTDQNVPQGKVPDISRFPWLGIVQHSFFVAGATRFAVTGAVLIHPAYAVAPAEDIAKIQPEQLINNTKFIIWRSGGVKFALDVHDYILHPDFTQRVTFATIALLQLVSWGDYGVSAAVSPVLPVCLPIKGSITLDELYAVKLTDESSELEKEVFKMNHVEDKDCAEFYFRAKLTYDKMAPKSSICAAVKDQQNSCIWDGGVALITRQNWGFWQLLGFGLRGPGCGAPTRFLKIHEYMSWINDVINNADLDEHTDEYKIAIRRFSPIKLIMYRPDVLIPKEQGECDRNLRGNVLYKDVLEVLMSKNFGQGFYYVVVTQIAQFTCGVVQMLVTSRTNVAMWLEHNCQRDLHGVFTEPYKARENMVTTRAQCFLYFKTAAYLEFRFFFSFKAEIETTMFGRVESPRMIPNPFPRSETTDPWYPTVEIIKWNSFAPYYLNYYWL